MPFVGSIRICIGLRISALGFRASDFEATPPSPQRSGRCQARLSPIGRTRKFVARPAWLPLLWGGWPSALGKKRRRGGRTPKPGGDSDPREGRDSGLVRALPPPFPPVAQVGRRTQCHGNDLFGVGPQPIQVGCGLARHAVTPVVPPCHCATRRFCLPVGLPHRGCGLRAEW